MESKYTTMGNITSKSSASRISSSTSSQKYRAHAGLKFNFNLKKDLITKSVSLESRTEKKQENVSTVTKQRVENQANKGGRTDLGMEDSGTTLRVDVKVGTMKNSVNRTQTTQNIQDDSEIALENEITDLCNRIPIHLRVLQPQPLIPKIPKSHKNNTLKLQVVTSNVSKLPTLNTRPVSIGRSTELEKRRTVVTGTKSETTPKKYGAHAGLKFPLTEKNVKPGETFNFSNKTSITKTYYCKIEKKSTQSKEMMTTKGRNLLEK